MKTNSLFWALSWVAVGSFAAMQGCGGDDDDDDGGDGSTGGKGGSAGSSTGGKGGSAGSSTGGKGGSAGSSTTGGTSGTSGAGGAPGGQGGDDGVGGEGGAGDTERAMVCTEYCTLYYAKFCQNAPTNSYDSMADCQTDCGAASYPLGTRGAAAGNSLHCRLTHAGLATDNSPPDNVHCGHASEVSTGVCVN